MQTLWPNIGKRVCSCPAGKNRDRMIMHIIWIPMGKELYQNCNCFPILQKWEKKLWNLTGCIIIWQYTIDFPFPKKTGQKRFPNLQLNFPSRFKNSGFQSATVFPFWREPYISWNGNPLYPAGFPTGMGKELQFFFLKWTSDGRKSWSSKWKFSLQDGKTFVKWEKDL